MHHSPPSLLRDKVLNPPLDIGDVHLVFVRIYSQHVGGLDAAADVARQLLGEDEGEGADDAFGEAGGEG